MHALCEREIHAGVSSRPVSKARNVSPLARCLAFFMLVARPSECVLKFTRPESVMGKKQVTKEKKEKEKRDAPKDLPLLHLCTSRIHRSWTIGVPPPPPDETHRVANDTDTRSGQPGIVMLSIPPCLRVLQAALSRHD